MRKNATFEEMRKNATFEKLEKTGVLHSHTQVCFFCGYSDGEGWIMGELSFGNSTHQTCYEKKELYDVKIAFSRPT